MIENSDYGLISDQLYLMPFLRRYAAFLNLDGEEVAMRFVREVQRAEVAATPRMSEPLGVHDRKRVPWGRVAVVIVVLSAIVVLYVIASEHHRGEFGFHHSAPPSAPSAPSAIVPPAVVAPAPPAANPPMTAEPPMAGPAPQAAAPAAPSRTQPRKPPSPADSENE
jgi:cytoskeletal protein RodZ